MILVQSDFAARLAGGGIFVLYLRANMRLLQRHENEVDVGVMGECVDRGFV